MTAEQTAPVDGIADTWSRRMAVSSVLAGMVLVVLDAAIANIALPVIAASLRVTSASVVHIITAYQLGVVMTLLPAAALGESRGFARVFTAGTAIFTISSVLCALCPSLHWLVAARFVQGVGGACIMALGVALLRASVPRARLGTAIGWNAMAVALSSAAGPTLGATILSISSWHWLFAVNLPIGICVLFAARALPRVRTIPRRIDPVSFGAIGLLLVATVAGAGLAPHRPAISALFFAGAACLATVLIWRERRSAAPLIPLDLLRHGSFRVSLIASILCFVGQATALVALPFYLQRGFKLSAIVTALYLLPWPLTVALTGPLAGSLADRVSSSRLCLIGGCLMTLGLGSAAILPLRHVAALTLCMAGCGVGFAFFNVSNNRRMFLSAPADRSGAAGGLQSLARLLGQTLGAAAMGFLFSLLPFGAAPPIGLGIAAALTLAAGAMNTMHPRGSSD